MSSIMAGQIRTVLAAGGGVILALGVADKGTVDVVTENAGKVIDAGLTIWGASQIIISAAWSWWEKRKAAKAS